MRLFILIIVFFIISGCKTQVTIAKERVKLGVVIKEETLFSYALVECDKQRYECKSKQYLVKGDSIYIRLTENYLFTDLTCATFLKRK